MHALIFVWKIYCIQGYSSLVHGMTDLVRRSIWFVLSRSSIQSHTFLHGIKIEALSISDNCKFWSNWSSIKFLLVNLYFSVQILSNATFVSFRFSLDSGFFGLLSYRYFFKITITIDNNSRELTFVHIFMGRSHV